MSATVGAEHDREGVEAPPEGGASRHERSAGPAPAVRPRRTLALVLGPALLIVLLVAFVAEPFRIPTPSMEPTLMPGDHVLLDKLAYRLGAPHRGDLAVFHAPDGAIALKRIVGLPGDRIGIEDGVLKVNGHLQRERYVDYAMTDSVYYGPITVPRGHVFVLGDNRSDSVDSRDYGSVDEDELMGRVAVRLWPLQR